MELRTIYETNFSYPCGCLERGSVTTDRAVVKIVLVIISNWEHSFCVFMIETGSPLTFRHICRDSEPSQQ